MSTATAMISPYAIDLMAPMPRRTDDDVRALVVEDPLRPGPVRVRVVYDDVNVSVWTLIGQLLYVYHWHPDSKRPHIDLIARVAADYAVPLLAVEAAVLYDQEHRGAIEAWLEENEGPRPTNVLLSRYGVGVTANASSSSALGTRSGASI